MIHGGAAVAVVIWVAAAFSALLTDPYTDVQIQPTRYCYSVVLDQPWSCYLKADRLDDHTPVWVGPENEVNHAYIGDRWSVTGNTKGESR